MRKIFALLATLAVVGCGSEELDDRIGVSTDLLTGTQTVDPPQTWLAVGDPTDAYVGNYIGLSQQVIVYKNRNTGICVWAQISASPSDWDHDVVVHLTPGNDQFLVLGQYDAVSIDCPANGHQIPLGPTLKSHGNLYVFGGWGSDTITCNVGCTAFGGPDSDVLSANAPSVLYGEDGNDIIYDNSSSFIYGGNGDDCLYEIGWSYRDCGPGTDRYVGPGNAIGCETAATTCFPRLRF